MTTINEIIKDLKNKKKFIKEIDKLNITEIYLLAKTTNNDFFLTFFAKNSDPRIKECIIKNPFVSLKTLKLIKKNKNDLNFYLIKELELIIEKREKGDSEVIPFEEDLEIIISKLCYEELLALATYATNKKILEIVFKNTSKIDIQKRLVRNSNLSEEMLEELSNINDLKRAVAENESTSVDTLNKLAFSDKDDLDTIISVIRNSKTTSDILEEIFNKYKNMDIKKAIAGNKNLNPKILDQLFFETDNKEILKAIAGNSNASTKTLIKLSEFNDTFIDSELARNPSTPKDVLNDLSKSNDLYILYSVAENINTSAETLDKLSKNILTIKYGVAKNENTSAKTLDRLSKLKNLHLKETVALNKKTSPETLDYLAKSKPFYAFSEFDIIKNPNTSDETLEFFLKDEDKLIREKALKKLEERRNLLQRNKK